MTNFCFDTICNIPQEAQQQKIQLCLWVHQQVCRDKISSIAVKNIISCFDQLETVSSSTSLSLRLHNTKPSSIYNIYQFIECQCKMHQQAIALFLLQTNSKYFVYILNQTLDGLQWFKPLFLVLTEWVPVGNTQIKQKFKS